MEKHESISSLIACLFRTAQIYFDKELVKFDLGNGTFVFLLPLFHKDGINQNEISRILHFDKAHTTRAIQKLIELGYIQRILDEDDNRAYKIYLTDKAKSVKPEIIKILHGWSEIISTGFSYEDKQSALKLLHRMMENALDFKNRYKNQYTHIKEAP